MRKNLVVLGAMALTLTVAQFAAGDMMGGSAAGMTEPDAVSIKGTVVETTNASRYTYVQIDTGKEKIWAAGPVVAVKVGDRVSIGAGSPNKNFYSPTLKRKFDELYFVGAIMLAGASNTTDAAGASALPPGHPVITTAGGATNTVSEVIQKPTGGKTVAEVWAGKAELSGKPVVVRARVVKVIPNVMGMTFLHLRDGTGVAGANDLTVSTKAMATVGQVVTASGLLTTDKDFGSGYKYDVIIEDAIVTVP